MMLIKEHFSPCKSCYLLHVKTPTDQILPLIFWTFLLLPKSWREKVGLDPVSLAPSCISLPWSRSERNTGCPLCLLSFLLLLVELDEVQASLHWDQRLKPWVKMHSSSRQCDKTPAGEHRRTWPSFYRVVHNPRDSLG